MSAKDCLKNARYKLGLSQKEFGDLLGISSGSLSLWETGRRKPRFKAIRQIVDTLKKHNIEYQYSDFKDI